MALPKRPLLILGAAAAQVPIVEKAAGLGFLTIVASSPGDRPAFQIAHRFYEIDVRDQAAMLSMARREKICGILTDQTDVAVPTVAYVAEHLGLPGIGLDCALRFTDKHRMRRAAQELGIPVPRFWLVSGEQDAVTAGKKLRPPFVVKPVDSQGSRGVTRVDDVAELWPQAKAALRFSRSDRVIVEEFFDGVEVVVQCFVSDFRVYNIALGDRQYFDLPGRFIPKSTVFPSLLSKELTDKILSANAKLVQGLGPRFGITHSEFLVQPHTGEICLVETAIRGGGVFISSDLVPFASGIDIGKLLIEHATGTERRVAIHLDAKNTRSAGYFCFALPEGSITRIAGAEAIRSLPDVSRVVLHGVEVGRTVSPLVDKTARLGPILITSPDRLALEATLQTVKNLFHIDVMTATGVRGIVW